MTFDSLRFMKGRGFGAGVAVGAPGELERYRKLGREQQARVDGLLGRWRRFGLVPDRRNVPETQWSAEIVDPEFQKNLAIFHRLIAGSIDLCERVGSTGDDGGAVLTRLDSLGEMITLPEESPLTIKILLAHRFRLERALVELGDEPYLRSRAEDLYDEGEGTAVTWKKLFAEPPPLMRGNHTTTEPSEGKSGTERGAGSDDIEQTRRMLAQLLANKEMNDLTLRARRELKHSALLLVVPTLVLTTALFALAIAQAKGDTGELLLAATAGANGAALGALRRLRDEIEFGSHIREFISFFLGHIVVGATAGLFALLVARSDVVRPGGGTAGLGAFAFAVGFSEVAFIGLVARIGERRTDSTQKGRPEEMGAAGP